MKTDRAKSLCAPLAEECGRDVGHIPQVSVHVTVLQTNKQYQKYLLALITQQNVVSGLGETFGLVVDYWSSDF